MSSASQISGLVSGLETQSIISALMSVERLPQYQLEDRKSSLTTVVSALQSLNVKTRSLGETAQAAAASSSWSALTAKSSSDTVTATAGSTATATSVSFTVNQVAQSQVSLTSSFANISSVTGGASTLSLQVGDDVTEIDVSGVTTVADLAQAITSSDAGVNASVIASADGNGDPIYRLQLTGRTTGADQAFTLYQGDAAAVADETATEVSLVTARSAQDAQLTMWSGTAAAQVVTSSTNTFDDLLTGLDVTVTEASTDPVTVDVTSDTAALTKLGSDLVSQLNQALAEITSFTKSTTTTDEDGNTVVSGGVLSGNVTVRMLAEDLTKAGSYDVNGVSPFAMGITVDRYGVFSIDEEKFAAALAADPSGVQEMLSTIAGRVEDVTTAASDKYTGNLTSQINSDNQQITSMTDRIASLESVLSLREDALERQWATLETALSQLNSQSSWLTSAIASLPSTSTQS